MCCCSIPFAYHTEPATEPKDVYFHALQMRFRTKQFRIVVSNIILFFLAMTYMIPITFIQSISTLDNLEKTLPWLTPLTGKGAIAKGLIEGQSSLSSSYCRHHAVSCVALHSYISISFCCCFRVSFV